MGEQRSSQLGSFLLVLLLDLRLLLLLDFLRGQAGQLPQSNDLSGGLEAINYRSDTHRLMKPQRIQELNTLFTQFTPP